MKRIGLTLIIITLFIGCASPRQPYIVPQYIKDRPSVEIFNKALHDMEITEECKLYFYGGKAPNAFVDANNNVNLSEGLFRYDDDTLTFVIVHEMAHIKLNHVQKKQAVSIATTGVMMIVDIFVPGAGLLNYAVNPAVTSNYSKPQEREADQLASDVLVTHFGISIERQIQILKTLQKDSAEGGGFWDSHPSWNDRIANIQNK
ncbi:MAG: M48 family metalloprotease [Pseudomonadota bacterium]